MCKLQQDPPGGHKHFNRRSSCVQVHIEEYKVVSTHIDSNATCAI